MQNNTLERHSPITNPQALHFGPLGLARRGNAPLTVFHAAVSITGIPNVSVSTSIGEAHANKLYTMWSINDEERFEEFTFARLGCIIALGAYLADSFCVISAQGLSCWVMARVAICLTKGAAARVSACLQTRSVAQLRIVKPSFRPTS